ncbi:hypothetical protein M404DRAFT_1005288 [Pisolithus tinctorius Marx 270]|uniref:Uncharacterized protein n=1 Tax=Pisolithus tinctorius Marx 270 TaxID=870435 RepID=A0A0C3NSW4_PISTI|nr:hypothetical protein M404DRAFT_1005288 [Pisolithus tinctorius Marx 270]
MTGNLLQPDSAKSWGRNSAHLRPMCTPILRQSIARDQHQREKLITANPNHDIYRPMTTYLRLISLLLPSHPYTKRLKEKR